MDREDKIKLAINKGFNCCLITGNITTPTGVIASRKTKNGYILLTVRDNKKEYNIYGHHFVWYCKNKECSGMLDHINRNKLDNSIVNLRKTNHSLNGLNRKSKGVYFDKRVNKFIAQITINYKNKYIGSYLTFKEASESYKRFKINFINKNTL